MTFELIEYHKSGSGDYILRIKHTKEWPRWIVRLFRLKNDHWFRTYIGSGTVWREYTSFTRCHSGTESLLSDIYAKIRHEEVQP